MSMNIKKILETAEELKLTTLRAKELGIIKYDTFDGIILVNENTFREMFKFKEYEEKERNSFFELASLDWRYKYSGKYDGQIYETYTKERLFQEVKNA